MNRCGSNNAQWFVYSGQDCVYNGRGLFNIEVNISTHHKTVFLFWFLMSTKTVKQVKQKQVFKKDLLNYQLITHII